MHWYEFLEKETIPHKLQGVFIHQYLVSFILLVNGPLITDIYTVKYAINCMMNDMI